MNNQEGFNPSSSLSIFLESGYLRIPGVFSRDVGLKCRDLILSKLKEVGIDAQERSTWKKKVMLEESYDFFAEPWRLPFLNKN
jgi:hypothetical protein